MELTCCGKQVELEYKDLTDSWEGQCDKCRTLYSVTTGRDDT